MCHPTRLKQPPGDFLPPPQGHALKAALHLPGSRGSAALITIIYFYGYMSSARWPPRFTATLIISGPNTNCCSLPPTSTSTLPHPLSGSIPDRKERHCRAERRFQNAGLRARYVGFMHRCSSRRSNDVKNVPPFAQEVTLRNPRHLVGGFSNYFTQQF